VIKQANENLKKMAEKNYIFGESDDERAFTVLEFIFIEQIQFKTFIPSTKRRGNAPSSY
jgi:hypothetical protein